VRIFPGNAEPKHGGWRNRNKNQGESEVPEDWKLGTFKKGDSRERGNYRGMTLIGVVAKICERILEGKPRRSTKWIQKRPEYPRPHIYHQTAYRKKQQN